MFRSTFLLEEIQLDLVYQDLQNILQLPEVTSVSTEYVELDKLIDF